MQSKLDIRQASTQSKHAIEVRGWTLLSSVQPWQIVQPRRWQHAHLYTEDHHKVFPAALVQSSIVRIWGQAQGPLAAPLHDVLHRRVPLRAAPLPRHVVLVPDLEWPGTTNDEARRKWLGMWLGTWFDAVFVGAGAPRSGAAPPWAFDCAVPPVEDLPPTIEGVHLAR